MPSLDGYSLNEKMDRLNDDVKAQIEQLQKDFHNLYNMIDKMKEKKDVIQKANKKSSTKKDKKEVAKEIA